MARLRYRLAVLFVALLGFTAISAPAAQAHHVQNFLIPLNNWKVGGSLGVKKLNQNIQLPPGSTFNGGITSDLRVEGHTTIPEFTATVKLLGLLPNHITMAITEVAPTSGTVKANPDGTTTTSVVQKADLRIKSLRAGILPVPIGSNCHTASPVVLNLVDTSRIDLTKGFAFAGTYTIPNLTGCGLVTPTLNLLMAGPNNPFTATLKPPNAP
jgi:hypothetical protein